MEQRMCPVRCDVAAIVGPREGGAKGRFSRGQKAKRAKRCRELRVMLGSTLISL